jgi:hypothetical protein
LFFLSLFFCGRDLLKSGPMTFCRYLRDCRERGIASYRIG